MKTKLTKKQQEIMDFMNLGGVIVINQTTMKPSILNSTIRITYSTFDNLRMKGFIKHDKERKRESFRSYYIASSTNAAV